MGSESKFSKIKKSLNYLDESLDKVIKTYHYPNNKTSMKLDYFRTYFMHGAAPKDYISLEMYKKNHRERKNTITFKRHNKLNHALNDYSSDINVIENKSKFNKLMAKYIKRKWLTSEESTIEERLQFLEDAGVVFFKPSDETKGQGIKKLSANEDSKKFLEQQTGSFVLEEVIEQNDVINKINPYAVNTVRVYTLLKKNGKAEVVFAALRSAATKAYVDNMAQGGFVYPIDIETGVICMPGVSYHSIEKSIFHPVTNTQVVGTKIPNFDILKTQVVEMAEHFDKLRYIGWDIAILEDGIDVVEANLDPCSRILQSDGRGKYLEMKSLI